MRFSQAFIPTQKEVPKDATQPSHKLLLRGGYVRMVGSGIYELLPLGHRVLRKIQEIVRQEMDAAGAHQMLLPILLPATYFQETGRFDGFGHTLLRLNDRKGGDYHLGPTHEEIVTDLARREIRSYKQLPLNLYQIQMKFRDEPRPRAGLLRCREFLMKDAYSFDEDLEAATKSYETMRDAYHRIFQRLGLEYRIVQADSGAMGGSTSAEFQVLAQTGEDAIVACADCEYAANVEVATAKREKHEATPGPAFEKVHTPGKRGIDDVVEFLGEGLTSAQTMKSMLYVSEGETIMAVVRGDHEVNEIKLARALGVGELRMASDKEVYEATNAPVGYAGPVGFEGRVIADLDVAELGDAVTGANENDHHLKHVAFGRDFEAEVSCIRTVGEGDACPKCGGALHSYRGIEGGHIFVLGTHYSEKMKATYLNKDGKAKPVVMGCYGIGVSRLVAAAIEQNHDEGGIVWPMSLAPYQVIVTPIGKPSKEPEAHEKAEEIYKALLAEGFEALLDDRNERPGSKFKDADLIGIPLRITVGSRGLKEGVVEFKPRTASDAENVPVADVVAKATAFIKDALA